MIDAEELAQMQVTFRTLQHACVQLREKLATLADYADSLKRTPPKISVELALARSALSKVEALLETAEQMLKQ